MIRGDDDGQAQEADGPTEVASMAEAALQRPDLSATDRIQIRRILAEARQQKLLPGETA